MYLTCSVTFEENTCILTFCMYFTRIPKESKIHLENISDTVHQDTCNLRASLVSHWIHIRIHQDTCILDSSSRYIRIHRDTKSRYMYLGRVMMTLQDTIRIHHDTCILDASSEPRWIHTRYARDTLQIHLSLINLACIMHVSCMYPQAYLVCIQVPARPGRSVQDTCIVIKYLDVS